MTVNCFIANAWDPETQIGDSVTYGDIYAEVYLVINDHVFDGEVKHLAAWAEERGFHLRQYKATIDTDTRSVVAWEEL